MFFGPAASGLAVDVRVVKLVRLAHALGEDGDRNRSRTARPAPGPAATSRSRTTTSPAGRHVEHDSSGAAFVPAVARVDRFLLAGDHEILKAVLEPVRGPALGSLNSRSKFVSFSVNRNSGCVPSATGSAKNRNVAQRRVRRLKSAVGVQIDARLDLAAFVRAAPRPGVAKPERRQQMQRRPRRARGWPTVMRIKMSSVFALAYSATHVEIAVASSKMPVSAISNSRSSRDRDGDSPPRANRRETRPAGICTSP